MLNHSIRNLVSEAAHKSSYELSFALENAKSNSWNKELPKKCFFNLEQANEKKFITKCHWCWI
ncbi:hypothetical protein HYD77_00815 [Mycoplasmopsis bovis]|nr:hypothetical protein [Mycoplasmopsis bovis]QQH43513.1 hypothetical protein HYD77_00815 [Mycoplasmopsis bovis]